ncbi:MAG: hypothetical protein P8Z41_09685 [Anaerolineales bacterium]|jgi:hypothetical protein
MQLTVFVAFPIHVWSIVSMLHAVPSLVLSMTPNEILGSWAYNMTFTLLETTIVLLFVLVVGIALSIRVDTTTFITLSSFLLTEIALMRFLFVALVDVFSSVRILIPACLFILILTVIFVPKNRKWNDITHAIATRFAVLTYIYIFIDVVGVIIVIVRLV